MQILLQKLVSNIFEALPFKEAGLLVGILFGEKIGFSKDFYSSLINLGIVHIVVVSGTNVVIIARFMIESLSHLINRKRAIVVGLVVIWFYAIMVGLAAPIIRAVLLISFLYWAQLLGRKFNIWRVIGLIFVMIVIADVKMLSNIGFWLSFVAFGAVVMDSKWVWLWITPILAFYFGKISLMAPFMNAMVLFLVQIVTIFGAIGAILNIKYILWLILPILRYIVLLAEILGRFKWISLSVRFNLATMIGSYLLLIWFYMKRHEK